MQIFKKNSMPNLVLFKKMSIPRHFGKKMMIKPSMNSSAMKNEEEKEKKKYHLEKPI